MYDPAFITHIQMSGNTLARVVRVKEVASGAGEPSRAVTRTLWRDPHLRINMKMLMMIDDDYMKINIINVDDEEYRGQLQEHFDVTHTL